MKLCVCTSRLGRQIVAANFRWGLKSYFSPVISPYSMVQQKNCYKVNLATSKSVAGRFNVPNSFFFTLLASTQDAPQLLFIRTSTTMVNLC